MGVQEIRRLIGTTGWGQGVVMKWERHCGSTGLQFKPENPTFACKSNQLKGVSPLTYIIG